MVGRAVGVARMSYCDIRDEAHPPDVAEPVIGCAFARPGGSSGLRRLSHARSPAEKHSPNARNPAKLSKSR